MGKTYIFGHRNNDTDSVVASIALAYLKNTIGFETEPRILSELNNETEFVLNYFNAPKPEYLNDVKIRIKDIAYEKGTFINENASIYDAINKMALKNVTAIPLINSKYILSGYVTLKEIAKFLTFTSKKEINASIDNILTTISGEIVTRYTDYITGNIYVFSIEKKHELDSLTENDILICNNNYFAFDHENTLKVKNIVVVTKEKVSDKIIDYANKNNITIIKSNIDNYSVINKIAMSSYIKDLNETFNPVVVYEDDYYSEFKNQFHKINHTNYPVVNKKGECLGLIRLTGSAKYEKRKVILVDHNMNSQSVIGIEEAEILEIIDHHNLGAMGTDIPINFRSMPVGSTATIIYEIYKENKTVPPKNIAGLLLAGILSDTLLLTSPTTTNKDKEIANILEKIAEIDMFDFGTKMLTAGSSIEGLSIKDLVYNDYKKYNIEDKQLGISVITTMDFDGLKPKIDEIKEYLNNKIDAGFDLSIMFVTDVVKNGSYLIYNDKSEELMKESFALDEIYQGIFIEGLISRKKQMLPIILEAIR